MCVYLGASGKLLQSHSLYVQDIGQVEEVPMKVVHAEKSIFH